MKTASILLLVTLTLSCAGESRLLLVGDPRKPPLAAANEAESEVTSYTLEFKKTAPVPGVTASPVTVVPAQCSADGTLFLDMVDPAEPRQQTVYSIQARMSHQFSSSAISDLHDIQLLSYFPSDSMVGFLVYATKETTLTQRSAVTPDGKTLTTKVNSGEHHYYIARFALDGSYKESIELPMQYPLFHLGILGSGEYLISGYDEPNSTARLLLLNSKGEVQRPVELPTQMQADPRAKDSASISGVVAAENLVGSIQFTSYKSSLLVWRTGANTAILEIGAGGSVREVSAAVPKGFTLADMVPSNDHWVAHYSPDAASKGSATNNRDFVYYELRPADGSMLRKLSLAHASPATIACENNGTYISYETDDKSRLIRLLAN